MNITFIIMLSKLLPRGTFLSDSNFCTTMSLERIKNYYGGINSYESLNIRLTVRGRNVRPNIIN